MYVSDNNNNDNNTLILKNNHLYIVYREDLRALKDINELLATRLAELNK